MFIELEELIKKWGTDIRTISIQNYKDYMEVLVNGHYIFKIEKTN